jgi:hypothetical protein
MVLKETGLSFRYSHVGPKMRVGRHRWSAIGLDEPNELECGCRDGAAASLRGNERTGPVGGLIRDLAVCTGRARTVEAGSTAINLHRPSLIYEDGRMFSLRRRPCVFDTLDTEPRD